MLSLTALIQRRQGPRVTAGLLTAAFAVGVCTPALADSLTLSPNPISVCVGGSNTFTATHTGGTGTNTISAAAGTGVTVSPASYTLVPKNVAKTFTATGVSIGARTVTVTDTGATSQTETVNVNGPIAPPASPLQISGTGAQSITVSDPGPAILVSATSSDPTVATVTATATTVSNNATFTVTPVNGSKAGVVPASTTITFTDAAGCASQTLTVNVTPGALTTSVGSLTFSGTTPQSFTASETDYTNLISAISGNTALATVSPASGSGPGPVSFTVTPTGTTFGSTAVTVTDDHSGSKSVTVLVTGGTISITGSSVASFTITDNKTAQISATPINVTGSLQTTSGGNGSIAVTSPAGVTGVHGATLPIAALKYSCTGNGSGNNQGATFVAGGPFQLVASNTASSCLTFPSGQLSTLNFFVNLFVDARSLGADTYNTGAFNVVLTET